PQIQNPNQLRPGQLLRIPKVSWGEIVVNGYAYPSVRAQTLASALPHLTFLSVFSALVQADGSLIPMEDDAAVIAQAKAAGTQPHLVVANLEENGGFQSATAAALLGSPQAQEALLRAAAGMMREKGYTGLDLDLEYVPAASREGYNCFLAKARAWMHDEDFVLKAAVAPKAADHQPGLLFEGFDYAAQGKYNDYVTLMTYEWGYQSGPPMAVAPVGEVRKVLDYAVRRIPPKKISLGIPNYGYDWTLPFAQGSRARVVQNPAAVELAAQRRADINYDETAQTPWFNYTDDGGKAHVVWFEDARSIFRKLELVREYGLGGVSYWTVNYPFPQNWRLLEEYFRVSKLGGQEAARGR
ncbi:MAG: spore gernimation protein, partial [Oscillospiraceae bacterium]|nr:spore gernimation protein [Oscillospiraceae bacterium]